MTEDEVQTGGNLLAALTEKMVDLDLPPIEKEGLVKDYMRVVSFFTTLSSELIAEIARAKRAPAEFLKKDSPPI